MDDARHSTDDLNSLLPLLALELCLHDRLNHLTAEDIRLVETTLKEGPRLFESPSIQAKLVERSRRRPVQEKHGTEEVSEGHTHL